MVPAWIAVQTATVRPAAEARTAARGQRHVDKGDGRVLSVRTLPGVTGDLGWIAGLRQINVPRMDGLNLRALSVAHCRWSPFRCGGIL
jgi:hypothetical protein